MPSLSKTVNFTTFLVDACFSVEDTDDLVPIFNKQSDMLKRTYGEYFLAEVVAAQTDHMKCIIAEVKGAAIGLMTVSDDCNVNILNDCYELGPFHGLRKKHPDDITEPQTTPSAEELGSE